METDIPIHGKRIKNPHQPMLRKRDVPTVKPIIVGNIFIFIDVMNLKDNGLI